MNVLVESGMLQTYYSIQREVVSTNKAKIWDFPGGAVVKTLCSQCGAWV